MSTASKNNHANEPRLNRNQAFTADSDSLSPPVLLRFPNVSPPNPQIQSSSLLAQAGSTSARDSTPGVTYVAPQPAKVGSSVLQIGSASSGASNRSSTNPAADAGVERSWGERFGSRLALLVLLGAVVFGALVAIKGQNGVEKIPPIAEDYSLTLDETSGSEPEPSTVTDSKSVPISTPKPTSRPSASFGDQEKADPGTDSAQSKALTQKQSEQTFEETLAAMTSHSDLASAQDGHEYQNDLTSPAAPIANQPTLSGPVTAYSPSSPSLGDKHAPNNHTPSETNLLTQSQSVPKPVTQPKSSEASSISVVAYPTTAFPNPVDWSRLLVEPNQDPKSRVAARPEAPRYPTTAWPNAPATTANLPSNQGVSSPVITR